MQATMPFVQANIDALEAGESAQAMLSPGIEQVFAEHKDLVFRAAYRVTGNAGDAEDVLQTVFLRLLRQEQMPDIRSMKAYLHRAAVNAALDTIRMKREKQNLPLDDQPELPGTDSAATRQESGELREWLRRALARLNPKWAEMFVLRFMEDYSNREIAREMKMSSAAVAVVLHRTRTQLRKDYKAMMGGRR